MDGFNHAASVSEARQVVAPQRVLVFGHHADDINIIIINFLSLKRQKGCFI